VSKSRDSYPAFVSATAKTFPYNSSLPFSFTLESKTCGLGLDAYGLGLHLGLAYTEGEPKNDTLFVFDALCLQFLFAEMMSFAVC